MKRTGRRTFLKWLPGAALLMSGFSIPRDIEWMGDEYRMLKDAALRRNRMGDKTLKIKSAIFTGGDFEKGEWENIHFENCTFYGRTQLKNLKNAVFERCSFIKANFQSYYMENVAFHNCKTAGRTYILNGNSSKNVIFSGCSFDGPSSEPNDFGGIKLSGDITFKDCQGKYMDLGGDGKVIYQNCRFQDVDIANGHHSEKPSERRYADVNIENCVFEKYTDMQASNLAKLSITNSQFNYLDITNSFCTGDVIIENVAAGALVSVFQQVSNIIIRNSRFSGAKKTEDTWMRVLDCFGGGDSLQTVHLEGVHCAQDQAERANPGSWIRGGLVKTTIRNCTLPICTINMKSAEAEIDGLSADTVVFSKCAVGKVAFKNVHIHKSVDFTGFQAKEADLSGLVRTSELRIVAQGSNLKL